MKPMKIPDIDSDLFHAARYRLPT